MTLVLAVDSLPGGAGAGAAAHSRYARQALCAIHAGNRTSSSNGGVFPARDQCSQLRTGSSRGSITRPRLGARVGIVGIRSVHSPVSRLGRLSPSTVPAARSLLVLLPSRCSCYCSSSGDDVTFDGDAAAAAEQQLQGERTENVVVSTTKSSRTVKAISHEPEYISERYVKGSLKFQIELERSFCLDENPAYEGDGDTGQPGDPSSSNNLNSRSTSGAFASSSAGRGDGEGLWRSETYLRQALKRNLKYKEVILRFPSEYSSVANEASLANEVYGVEPFADRSELYAGAQSYHHLNDEEEIYLRRALSTKRQIASEIFEASLRAGQLGPMFTKLLLSCSPQFIDRIVTEAVALKKLSMSKELSFNSRARLYISSSKVIELVKWLKHQHLTAPRIGRLISVADESFKAIRSRVEWLKTVYVRGRDLGVIIERYPQILQLSVDDLNRIVDALENAGVQRKWLGVVVSRQPRVLTLSSDEVQHKISMFTVELGISKEQFGIMVYKFPAIVGHFSVEHMQARVDYIRQIGIDDAVLVKILASAPQLLACSISESWDRLLRYFYFLRIDLPGVRRILGVNPSVFCLNLEENIAPKVRFLLAIGVHEESLGQLIVGFPAILTYSLERKIRPLVRFLLEEAGVTEKLLGKVITLQPELLRCSLPHKLRVLVQYLKSKRISLDQLGSMIEDFPALLMYSVPSLHPKLQYAVRVMKRPLTDIVSFPRYFSYALQSRIIPRHEMLEDRGLTFSLRYMLACSDAIFDNRVQSAVEGRMMDIGNKNSSSVEEEAEQEEEDRSSGTDAQEEDHHDPAGSEEDFPPPFPVVDNFEGTHESSHVGREEKNENFMHR